MSQMSQICSLYRVLFRGSANIYLSKLIFDVVWLGQIYNPHSAWTAQSESVCSWIGDHSWSSFWFLSNKQHHLSRCAAVGRSWLWIKRHCDTIIMQRPNTGNGIERLGQTSTRDIVRSSSRSHARPHSSFSKSPTSRAFASVGTARDSLWKEAARRKIELQDKGHMVRFFVWREECTVSNDWMIIHCKCTDKTT